jgi:hypothetical protein
MPTLINHIDSAKLKLLRAAEHIEEIKGRVATYAACEPHEIIVESESKSTMKITFPPHDLAVPIGEALYQMRSALDHLAFGLVKMSNIGAVDWDKVAFPLKLKLPKSVPAPPIPFGHDSFATCLPGIPIGPFTFIEALQPYYTFRDDAACTWLRFLAQLSNIDKHRRFNLLAPRIRYTERTRDSYNLRTFNDGAEVHRSIPVNKDASMDVERRFTAIVVFNESGALGEAKGLPVEYILESCLETINVIIVPAFEKFI